MDIRLQHRVELKQTLTPQLIQTMELIQLPIQELMQKLRQELNENPMLETKQEKSSLETEQKEPDSNEMGLSDYKKLFDGLKRMDADMNNLPYDDDDDDDISPFAMIASTTTVYETLMRQISLVDTNSRVRALAEFIIGNLDDSGMLSLPLEELLESVKSQELVKEPTMEEMEEALGHIQALEPAGVGSRDTREYYLIQLENADKFDALAYEIVRDHFSMLGSKNLPQMQKILDEPIEKIKNSLYTIYHLKTHPFPESDERFENIAIEPDIVVKKVDDEWQVVYNNFEIPPLRISNYYLNLLKNKNLSEEIKEFLKNKFDKAKYWIEALMQRQQNMENTMEAIIKSQIDFFEKGPDFIVPMKMEDIANEISVHPATVSRIAKGKYVQTPHGVFPMKYFFTRGLTTDSGEDMSTRIIKQRLAECIEKENKAKPLSDQKIVGILTAEGINIARRTVAKYREELEIPSARMRKLR